MDYILYPFIQDYSIQTAMRNGLRETIQLCLSEKLKKSEISCVESNRDWRKCPTECEMLKDPAAVPISRWGTIDRS